MTSPEFLPARGARIGDYVIEDTIGQGGMGTVFLARHAQLGTRYALKVQRLGPAPTRSRRLARFERETTALAKVDKHPNIVRIHHYGVDPRQEGLTYCVMELIDGQDLGSLLEVGPLDVDRALAVAEGVARALAHVHAAGIVHRDLKPPNILIRRDDGAPLLTDFGLARQEDEERLTETGQIVGTISYMAPEQAVGSMSVGPAADVFALGAVLYHMLSGRPPFVADDMISTLAMITDVDPTPLAEARPTAPRDLDRLLDHALAKPPEARPSAEMLAEGLARIRRGEPLGWGGSSVWRQALYRVKRRDPRALLAICVALVLGVVLGSGGLYARYTRSRQAATADLQEHLRWEERSLTPLRLGLLGSDLEEAEVSARAEAVAALAATLGEPTSDAALARVRAYQRWLRFRAGGEPDIPAGRSSARPVEHLVVDARILRAQGKHEEARRRLLDLQHPAARLLELQLQADQDPHTFLERLPGLQDSEELAFARSLAPQLFATQWEQVARRACSADDQGSLHRLAKAAEALPPDLALRVAETKRRALDAAAPDWTRALLAAVGRKRDDVLLQRLQRLLDCAPAVRPGPALEAACSAALSAVLDAEWAALNRRDEEAARRVLRAEDLVFSLAPARREVRRMRIAIEAAHIRFKSPPGEWVVQRVRYGRISDSNTLPAERLSLIESRYSADCPLLAVLRVADRLTRALLGTRRASLADTLELLDAAEAALEVEDVRAWVDPRFEAKLLLDAMTMVYLHDKRHPGHVEREAATRRGLALVQRARRALLEDGINAAESADDLLDIYEFEARFQDALGRAGGAIEVWGAACARFEELARTTQEKPFQREYNSQLTKALEAKAEALLALGRAPEALAACDEIDALRKQLSTDLLRHDDKGRARGLRVRAHRLLGDLKTAQAVIEAGLPQALESPLFFGELVHTYVAAGRADEALRLCDEALREDRSRNWRAQLLTLRRLALSSKSRKR